MKVWVIGRPIEGYAWLSGTEYMRNCEGEYYTFNTEQEAIDAMNKYFSELDILIDDMFVVDVDSEYLELIDPEDFKDL